MSVRRVVGFFSNKVPGDGHRTQLYQQETTQSCLPSSMWERQTIGCIRIFPRSCPLSLGQGECLLGWVRTSSRVTLDLTSLGSRINEEWQLVLCKFPR